MLWPRRPRCGRLAGINHMRQVPATLFLIVKPSLTLTNCSSSPSGTADKLLTVVRRNDVTWHGGTARRRFHHSILRLPVFRFSWDILPLPPPQLILGAFSLSFNPQFLESTPHAHFSHEVSSGCSDAHLRFGCDVARLARDCGA